MSYELTHLLKLKSIHINFRNNKISFSDYLREISSELKEAEMKINSFRDISEIIDMIRCDYEFRSNKDEQN